MNELNRKVIKGLEKAIEWDRQSRIRRIEEDDATAEHEQHQEDGEYDPYCRECPQEAN